MLADANTSAWCSRRQLDSQQKWCCEKAENEKEEKDDLENEGSLGQQRIWIWSNIFVVCSFSDISLFKTKWNFDVFSQIYLYFLERIWQWWLEGHQKQICQKENKEENNSDCNCNIISKTTGIQQLRFNIRCKKSIFKYSFHSFFAWP